MWAVKSRANNKQVYSSIRNVPVAGKEFLILRNANATKETNCKRPVKSATTEVTETKHTTMTRLSEVRHKIETTIVNKYTSIDLIKKENSYEANGDYTTINNTVKILGAV